MASLSGVFNLQEFTDLGALMAGGRLYTYTAATTTKKVAYTDAAATVPHTYTADGLGGEYIALNSRGELPAPLFLTSGAYDIALKTPAGVTVWTRRAQGTSDASSTILTDLASTTDAAKGPALVGFGYDLQYPSDTLGAHANYYINTQEKGAITDDATNNTTAIQTALSALGARGGLVENKRGTKFNLQSLTFPIRSNFSYWMDDDLSRPNPSTTLGTNERVFFTANANAGGVVNEHRFTAALHPALIVDTRRDVPGHDAYLGASQKRVPTASVPARASYNIHDQQTDLARIVTEIYGGDFSNFSGLFMHAWRRVYTITGIGTASFTSLPAVGTEITGTVSGAKGWFLSSTATTVVLLWNSGKFAAGDALTDNNETTVATASSVAFTLTTMQPLSQGINGGNWSIGLPPGAARDVFAVGGGMCAMPTRSFGQYIETSYTDPYIAWADAVSDIPTNGYRIRYDTVPAAASRRLWLTTYASATKLAPIGILRAKVAFSNSALVETSAANVTSVTRTALGKYTVAFTANFARADYAVLFGRANPADYPTYTNRTTSQVEIWNYNSGGALADLVNEISVICVGGDI